MAPAASLRLVGDAESGASAATHRHALLGHGDGAVGTRPVALGKFLFVRGKKLCVKGVTYGAFAPDTAGNEYHDVDQIERDFAQMAAAGINTVRIPHTMPPGILLDIAERHGLWVMVGLSAEQFVGYLIDAKGAPDVVGDVRAKVRRVAGHPALLCYAIGNEIPAPTARWLGPRRIERYLRRIAAAIRAEDPDGLVTYVNYPTTEYLDLPFLDLLCFNVYLESEERLEAYLARLQTLAGDRPLLLTEAGLDAMRNGEARQAEVLDWQIRATFGGGAAGIVIFSWTDEWHRAEQQVEDWAFGITDIQRRPKPALETIRRAFASVPHVPDASWPHISVVVCSYNGARTIRDTLEGLARLTYPNYDVIVVNDGSQDSTPAITAEYAVRLISTENRGLSAARNTGCAAATGEIVAYIDDDAYPDPDWLTYLAAAFRRSDHVGIGGPNLPPPGDGSIAECVANAPGGPMQVLITDTLAEHIPGCNMAFRKTALDAVGGFDARYRAAGDDVDICWRLQERGWTIGFAPAALVWHHRRDSVEVYWRQQKGYGKAEALLAEKWPARYNRLGHLHWRGRIYGSGLTQPLFQPRRVFHGVWGGASFQSLYQGAPPLAAAYPLMPEWFLLPGMLLYVALLGLSWPPLGYALPLALLAVLPVLGQAALSAARGSFKRGARAPSERLRLWAITATLHVIQPLARLWGRLQHGLTPWRGIAGTVRLLPRPRRLAVWTTLSEPPETRLAAFIDSLRGSGCTLAFSGPYDRWDVEVLGGALGSARALMSVEDHGAGNQFVRVRMAPHWPRPLLLGLALPFAGALGAAMAGAWIAALGLGALVLAPALAAVRHAGGAMYHMERAATVMTDRWTREDQ
ncbi:MAG: glycosyltransferase [Alphaproteobacteria bacterium]|nr:glycosyltransferase [Alphaproteobacteria bacterium]